MGTEIESTDFTPAHYAEFRSRLQRETDLLADWIRDGSCDAGPPRCGFELEACLVDEQCNPNPCNEPFLARLNSPLLVPELARFNFEINSTPHAVGGNLLRRLFDELDDTWHQCEVAARAVGAMPVMTGILPTLRNTQLNLGNVSSLQRYHALNREVLRLREGQPLRISIDGDACRLEMEHRDVMAEAATTSLQVHLQTSVGDAARLYNAAQVMSAPLLAATVNSPYLFETELWRETRIPLFEQAVALPPWHDPEGNAVQRVTFGSHHVRESLMELFEENRDCIPVLLPVLWDAPDEELRHLRLHNGTIWRWNRPLIGLPPLQAPHLRVELRVIPAGPSIPDVIANIALLCGLVYHLSEIMPTPGACMPFATARDNFYAVARAGLDAEIQWDGRRTGVRELLLSELLPAARNALSAREFDADDVREFFDGVIEPRVRSGQTGADWQRRYIRRHGPDFHALTRACLEQQRQRTPVHEWTT